MSDTCHHGVKKINVCVDCVREKYGGVAAALDNPTTGHVCYVCGSKWTSEDQATARRVELAAKINGTGPYCNLCLHLEMASRYAEARGYSDFIDAVKNFLTHRNLLRCPDEVRAEAGLSAKAEGLPDN